KTLSHDPESSGWSPLTNPPHPNPLPERRGEDQRRAGDPADDHFPLGAGAADPGRGGNAGRGPGPRDDPPVAAGRARPAGRLPRAPPGTVGAPRGRRRPPVRRALLAPGARRGSAAGAGAGPLPTMAAAARTAVRLPARARAAPRRAAVPRGRRSAGR